MANDTKVIDKITAEALDVLHQRLTFVGSINMQYDDQYAQEGAKIGDTLRIRLPSQYSVRTGRTINVQDNEQQNTTITMATQMGIDVEFTSKELALDINSLRRDVLVPQMSRLAAEVEYTVLNGVTKQVNSIVDQDGTAFSFDTALAAGEALTNQLAPDDEQRTLLLAPRQMRKAVNANLALFNDPKEVSSQYRNGVMGHAAGFDWAQSTHVIPYTTGTAAKTTGYTVNGATQNGSTITIQTGSTTFLVGDIVTFAGAYRVHPETKVVTADLMQFVVTANSGTSATSLSISPPLIPIAVNAAKANVSAYPDNTGAVVKVGAGASETLQNNLAYHKNAFAFVSADLRLPTGNAVQASRQQFEGLSLRLVQGYDITNDTFPSRWDILFGYKCIRPELAVRVHADG